MILFPLGKPTFAGLGSAGISMFYVSTIIAQLIFSAGSIFRGGVGSELVLDFPLHARIAN
jgi:sulfate permease, SulP family